MFSPLLDTIGHNNPRRAVQVVGNGLHDVLRVRLGQPDIPRDVGPEPPVHRAVSPFHRVAELANGLVHRSLAFRQQYEV